MTLASITSMAGLPKGVPRKTPEEKAARKKVWHQAHPLSLTPEQRVKRNRTSKEWDLAHPEEKRARLRAFRLTSEGRDKAEHDSLMRRFAIHGLTLDQYHAIIEQQDFRCAICGIEPKDDMGGSHDGFVIDHHHVTNRVRGLLCNSCNPGIGMLKTPEICLAAATYLTRL